LHPGPSGYNLLVYKLSAFGILPATRNAQTQEGWRKA
jgi:hypothetical protein